MTTAPSDVTCLPEPLLSFGYGQAVEDPRDGLTLFGPLDAGRPYGIRAGVIGTQKGVDCFVKWTCRIQGRLTDAASLIARPPFPGFEEAFRIPWGTVPSLTIVVPEAELDRAVRLDDRHQRVHQTVSVFADRLQQALLTEETKPDLWFVVIPDRVYEYCRPKSVVASELRIRAPHGIGVQFGRRLRREPSLFPEDNIVGVAYQYDVDFHNQLKARLLSSLVLTQVVRESTIALDGIAGTDRPKRDMSKFQAAIAWNLSTAAFYKAGGRPWKIEGIREGVCYIGMVFKQDQTQVDPRTACCAAQMFLDSGDGVVFRGAVGPWYAPDTHEYHLSRVAAKELVSTAVNAYAQLGQGPPKELFLHGKVRFKDEEWDGFSDAVDSANTKLVGIQIQDERDLRLFRLGTMPVLRGLAYLRNARSGYLWTRGYAPRLQTYVGREVPRPLRVDISHGEADLKVVLTDIMALTKVNYNTCLLADGMPVTLRFANAVGEILTAGPVGTGNPLPFKHYI